MDMANFSSCRLFENETTDTKNYMVDCPRAKCCFVLREYMSIEFWGRHNLIYMKTNIGYRNRAKNDTKIFEMAAPLSCE